MASEMHNLLRLAALFVAVQCIYGQGYNLRNGGNVVLANSEPLVTARTIERAKQMSMGTPLKGIRVFVPEEQGAQRAVENQLAAQHIHVAPKHTMLEAAESTSAYANVPWWVFFLTFVGSIAAICTMFYVTERMWDKRQQS
eukprot:755712-Hanusia_phi.AAC.1